MKVDTKLLFGIRTSESISLSVTVDGQLPAQPPDVRITTRGRGDAVIPCRGSAWVVALEPGDHVVFMPVPASSWFGDPVRFTLSAPATIVVPGETVGSPIVTWTATLGAADDPKNPWPPPLIGQLDTPPFTDPAWISDMLAGLRAQAGVERLAPAHVRPLGVARQDRTR